MKIVHQRVSGQWVKGAKGQTCDGVCQGIAKQCNSEQQSSLDTKQKVDNAFRQAGYTCKSFVGKNTELINSIKLKQMVDWLSCVH